MCSSLIRIRDESNQLEIRCLILKDLVNKENIIIEHIDIKNMIFDPLTKRLRFIMFKKHIDIMCILEPFDVLG